MRSSLRALKGLCIAALIVATAIPTDAAPLQGERSFVTLHVNTLDQGETVAVLRNGDVLIPVAVLEEAGVHGFAGKREIVQGQPYVSLRSLAPDVRFSFDPDALSLEITIAPQHMPTLTLDLNRSRPAHVEYTTDRSAFANYALSVASGGGANAYLELGQSTGHGRIDTSFTGVRGTSIRRGETYWENDDRIDSIRRVAGDFVAATGDLGGSAFIAGYGISRAFELDPYAVHFALPSLSGAVTTPSTADVYVNGVLVKRLELPPGAFDLNNIPVTTGSANTQIVLTDAFGRSQTFTQQYYASADVLAPGTTDFQYSAGLLRNNAFQVGDSYGPAAAAARYRIGLTSAVTAGARFEATPSMISAGPSLDMRFPAGAVHVALAAGSDHGILGGAASASYTYATPRFSAGAAMLLETSDYPTLSQPATLDRPISSLSTFGSVQVSRTVSAQVQLVRRQMRDSGTSSQIAFGQTVPLDKRFTLTLAEEHETSATRGPSNAISMVVNFATGRFDAATSVQAGTQPERNVQLSQSPPGRYGMGYVASISPAEDAGLNGTFYYRGRYGDYAVDYGAQHGTIFNDALRVSGGVAFIGGGAYPSRALTGSFALVEVPETPGVHVYFENEDAGKTNRHGRLLVTDLLPNYGNELRIDDGDAPLNTSIQTVSQLIAPPVRAGAVARFEAQRLVALSGKILVRIDGKSVVPSYGQLTIHSASHEDSSIIGASGEFYLENVPPGAYDASVIFARGTCRFTFTGPAQGAMLIDMGTLTCDMQ